MEGKMNASMMDGMLAIRDLAEKSIKDLALARALMLKTGANEEDVTEFINRTGEEYGAKYDKMTLGQPLADMVGDMLKSIAEREDK